MNRKLLIAVLVIHGGLLPGAAPLVLADVSSPVVLSEIMADNEAALLDEDGDSSDWLELENTGATAVDLNGYYLTTDPLLLTEWQFPAVTLAAGEFLLVFASDKDRAFPGSELHTNFKLSAGGEYLALVMPDGVTVACEFAPQYPDLAEDQSYGRVLGTNVIDTLATPTPGAPNSGAAESRPRILSFMAQPPTIFFGSMATLSWQVENAEEVTISGFGAVPATGSMQVQPFFDARYLLNAVNQGSVATATTEVDVFPGISGLSATPQTILPGGSVILDWEIGYGIFRLEIPPFGPLESREPPHLFTPWNTLLVAPQSTWKYLDDGTDQGTAWRDLSFDDAAWLSGEGPFGQDLPFLNTETSPETMTVYGRKIFQVSDPDLVRGLRLRLLYDDGVAVYLNGVEIVRAGLPGGDIHFDTPASEIVFGIREEVYHEFVVDSSLLNAGANVLAVEVHNTLLQNEDSGFDAGLTAWIPDGPSTATIRLEPGNSSGTTPYVTGVNVTGDTALPEPPTIAITELYFQPESLSIPEIAAGFSSNLDFEFVEIMNTGNETVSLAGVQLTDDARFAFPADSPQTLEPGEYGLLVARIEAFETRYGQGLPVLGEFLNSHRTTNGLLNSDGHLIERFTYGLASPWPSLLSSPGHALERIDPAAPATDPDNWRYSRIPGGSPGEETVPDIVSFTADRQNVLPGDTVTLSWQVEDSAGISLDHGIGSLPGGEGSVEVVMEPGAGSQTFTLTAFSEYRQVTASVKISVAPEIIAFTATPYATNSDGLVLLEWALSTGDAVVTLSPATLILNGEFALVSASQRYLFLPNSVWKYLDDGSDQGTAWRTPEFDDSIWSSGPGPLGFGDEFQNTILNNTGGPLKFNITTWFRKSFDITEPAEYTALQMDLLRDDGAVVYLNGTEVLRSNMPAGPVDWETNAISPVSGAEEQSYFTFPIGPNRLVSGSNTLAVEVHQSNIESTDLAFDAALIGTPALLPERQTFTLTASNDAGSASAQLTVLFDREPVSFGIWAAASGIPGAAPEGDEDKDGLSNYVEFATGSPPQLPTRGNPLELMIEHGYLEISFPQNLGAADVRYLLEVSEDLRVWRPATGAFNFAQTLAADGEAIAVTTYRSSLPLESAGTGSLLYFRLRLE